MSYSSLWGIDKSYKGSVIQEFDNSWWFSPIVWDVLFEKYLPDKMNHPIMGKMYFMTAVNIEKSIFSLLNTRINESSVQSDRMCWEISNQQVFFTKDKQFITDSIKKFMNGNTKYYNGILTKEHIRERFKEICNAINTLDKTQYPNFVFKNTSVDDLVEYWFYQYNEITEEYEQGDFSQYAKPVTEFVIIKDNKIDGFIDNVDYFNTINTK